MKRKVSALILAVLLGGSAAVGCGAESGDDLSAEYSAGTGETAETETEISQEAYDDIISYLTGGEVSAEDVLYTVNGVEITAAEYFYYVTMEEYVYIYDYYYTYYTTPDLTEVQEDGSIMAEDVTADAYLTAVYDAAVYAAALEAGVELTEEYQDALDTYAEESARTLGETSWETAVSEGTISEDDYTEEEKENWIAETGGEQFILNSLYYSTTEDAQISAYERSCYAEVYRDILFGEGGELEPSDEEIDTYISENGVYACRYILIDDYEDSAEGKAMAEEIYEELSSLSGDEFDEAFLEYCSDNADGNTTGEYVYDSSDSVAEGFPEAVESLNTGEMGITDETVYGYFIVVRDEVSEDSVLTSANSTILDLYISEAFQELGEEWYDEAEVIYSGALDEIEVADYFDALEAFREILEAAVSAQAAE